MTAAAEIRTTCPYCGVGCGVLARVEADGRVAVRGDPAHPANRGRLCSKGAALGETTGLEERLLHPEVRGSRASWDVALGLVAGRFAEAIATHGPDAVAFYVSGQMLTEDYYVANKLMKGFIGSANIDTNSRLCMASAVAGHRRAFGADVVPGCYEDIERAKLVVLVGSNAAWCHPVLYQRLAQARREHDDLKVVVIDPRRTASADIADLHLPIRIGTDTVLYNGLLAYVAEHDELNASFVERHTEGLGEALAAARAGSPDVATVAAQCGLATEQVRRFYELFARTERVVTLYSQGVNQSSSGTDKVNAIINCHLATGRIGRPGMGPLSLTGQPNAMGGREVGGLANQLAAHLELGYPAHRELVRRFWRAPRVAQQPGLKAVELFEAVEQGRIKALWIMATNPAVSLPDAGRVRRALAGCDFVVVSDCVRDTDTTRLAHVLLPALAWGEKDGSVTNSERRISRSRAFLPAPGEARPDWWIVCEVAKRLGFREAFDYPDAAAIFGEHAALSAHANDGTRAFDIGALAGLDAAGYERLEPVQWPATRARPEGTARCFVDGGFYTPSGRARFVAVVPRPPAHAPDDDHPLALATGRVRDHWHTLTRTGASPRLSAHVVEPYVEVSPDDAARFGLADGGLARVISAWGEACARVRVSSAVSPGAVFAPMHWNDRFASAGCVNRAVNPATDPVSGEPEFKHTPVRLEPVTAAWHGFLLSRRRVARPGADYWAVARGDGLWRHELAGKEAPDDWTRAARALLCADDAGVEWIEYVDRAGRRYRAARLVGGRLESCLFVGPDPRLPSREWLQGLFALPRLDAATRTALLAGTPPKGQADAGRRVCACFAVGERTLREAIHDGCTSVEALGRRLGAGSNCGSCIPELRALLAQSAVAGSGQTQLADQTVG
ncbi:nitrate reductase [Sulfurifustis variabilis]|uniref:Nitrate reductase n=1 Tax=Sulfurifustis variabilis TaxID=1675686 RepID=A0A1B4V7D3_9GAMM|nr:nitrate reductase [Sulfurifustis variabilis]BAU49449.1 nitrate reductase [Sulfurifustis variabilis]